MSYILTYLRHFDIYWSVTEPNESEFALESAYWGENPGLGLDVKPPWSIGQPQTRHRRPDRAGQGSRRGPRRGLRGRHHRHAAGRIGLHHGQRSIVHAAAAGASYFVLVSGCPTGGPRPSPPGSLRCPVPRSVTNPTAAPFPARLVADRAPGLTTTP
jgi:hypothetical protein